MQRLSAGKLNKAVAYIKQQARPIDKALYAYEFENGTVQAVTDELRHFQNRDGGFGHGLEADLRLSDSSVIATTIAFQVLRKIHVPSEHPMVKAASQYLRDTYDSEAVNWPIMPPNVDDAPHAPWWEYGGELSQSKCNPRAEILGYLYEYPDQFEDAMRQQVTQSVIDYLLTHADQLTMQDLYCYLSLYETPTLPDSLKTQMLDSLKGIVDRLVERDPNQWHTYSLHPLSVASHPHSPFAASLAPEIEANLDFVIGQQHEEGYWGPNWTWFGLFPDAWAEAECELRGMITVNTLRTLKAFDRL